MNPAASWSPIGASTTSAIRRVATTSSTSIRSASGIRFYSATRPALSSSRTQACTNSLRKTLHPSFTARLTPLTTSPASTSLPTTRFGPIIRRGFASQSVGKTATSASTTSSPAASGTVSAPASQKAGFMDKIKQLIKQYGYTGVAVYLGISTLDLAATFVIVKAAGMEKIEKAQDWVLEHVGTYFGYKSKPHSHPHNDTTPAAGVDLDKVDDEQVGAIYNKASGLWSVFVIAYGIHKLLVPLRVVATSMITPPLVKWLVKKGWIKEVAKKGAAVTARSSGAAAAASAPKP
ncbi:hypothetical protein BGX29_003440 [Mortierella sp. GBA35]|nr:hypothetical protein BGX29_003440 [Mortierella sp. GBA35]KAG0218299.1 hypothetical protein BGX33_007804 [Mortierella sp. NVP41]